MHSYRKALFLSLFTSAAVGVNAASSSACRGHCVHESRATKDQAGASVIISGPSHTVSDLTSSADWEMIACPKSWPEDQSTTIRLVCTAEDPSASCAHVTEQGAVNTVVRMPAECGSGPFARIAAWDVASDQSIPSDFAAQHGLKAGAEVVEATVDYKFNQIPEGRGKISFDVRAARDPAIRKRLNTAEDVVLVLRDLEEPPAHAPALPQRGAYSSSFEGVADADVVPAADFGIHIPGLPSVHVPIPTALPTVKLPDIPIPTLPSISLPSITVPHIPIPTSLPQIPLPNIDKSDGITVLDLQRNLSLFNTDIGCHFGRTSFDATISVEADLDVQIYGGYAIKISGSFPSHIAEFALAGVLSGKVHTTFNLDMYLNGDVVLPPKKLLDIGVIPGLSIPGIMKLGPSVALELHTDVMLDIQMNAVIPVTWEFERLDFVFPQRLAQPNNGKGDNSKNTANFHMSMAPGDIQASIGIHLLPKLEFGLNILNDVADAELFVGVDVDATYNGNGTIHEDFSMDGCQDVSIGATVEAGVTASVFSFLTSGEYYPIYTKRDTLWSHCSVGADGPATAIYDNGDGTYSNASGDLVNENGQLIDDQGNVIPDEDAADAAPPPVYDEDGQAVPDDQLIIDNGDGTYEDSEGNPVNKDGQRIADSGAVMGCDLDTSDLVDDQGNPIAPEDAIFDNGDGTYSNGKCQTVNEDGQPIDQDGNVIDYEPITDDQGNEIPPDDVVIDNGDGTYSDAYGNPVDQYGGAIDVDENGNVIPVDLTPQAPLDTSQEPADAEVTDDPEFVALTPDQLKSLAVDLVNGLPATVPPAASTDAPAPTATETAPVTDTTDAPVETGVATDAPVPTTTAAPTCRPVTAKRSVKNKKRAAKRSMAKRSKAARSNSTVSALPLQRRTLEFGCYPPSLGGMYMPPITGVSQLAPFY
ncbi:hypothetical protein EXIGLDRAFT_763771 [Exidia glandulosa HHB12029]|uniref:Uncharacterized protein n=1 Tax=Exidia glandulosa HHB12029 TaxID=1314781 RepID=A0A165LNB2_EXIGL|nr:hypothetical protein EXIGLDRAFT_763771 [Exidia glandulosa HHB12029]